MFVRLLQEHGSLDIASWQWVMTTSQTKDEPPASKNKILEAHTCWLAIEDLTCIFLNLYFWKICYASFSSSAFKTNTAIQVN